jgi:hypothetical protein
MNDDEPFDAAVQDLLAAERSRPEDGGELGDRVFERLAVSIGTGVVAAGAVAGASRAMSLTTSKIAVIVLSSFGAGIGVGVLGHATLAERPAPTAIATSAARSEPAPVPVTAAPPSITSTRTVDAQPPIATSAPVRAAVSARPAPSSSDKDDRLARERAWIDQARMALVRGSARDALVALDAHAREFPSGRMTEEREALGVHALAASGQTDQARARADAFRTRWPASVFGPVVDRAVPR